MPSLPMTIRSFPLQSEETLTRNVPPLLHEIRHALEALLENGATTTIDLHSIPLAPGEETALIETLGRGELEARLNALGHSEIIETAHAGVWLVTHYNEAGEMVSRFVEVTKMPEILRSQPQDIAVARDRLDALLQRGGDEPDKTTTRPGGETLT